MDTDPNPELTQAFKVFTDEIVKRVQKVNAACLKMKQLFPGSDIEVIPHDTHQGDGAAIREYETAMEELKWFIENQNCDRVHNTNLKRSVGASENKHAIRALEVELVHPEVDSGTIENPEWRITGVRVRGLISIYPASGNESPNYSSKSSSSSVPH